MNVQFSANTALSMKQLTYCLSGWVLAGLTATAHGQSICVFDLTAGEGIAVMKDYLLAAKQWTADLTLAPYNNEEKALQDFKSGNCQALLATSFATRQFNSFTGTLNAIGAIPSESVARNILLLMGSSRFESDMVEGGYESAGVIPVGMAYLITKDRNINTLAKMEGKRLGVLKVDPVQRRMAQKVGIQPVEMTIDNAAQKFRDNEIEILPSPTYAFVPFEVYRSMGAKGGIAHFPLSFITMNLIIRKGEFPSGFGQKSRDWFVQQTPAFMKKVAHYEHAVPAKAWFDIPEEDQVGYFRLLHQMRIEFINNKTYNAKMMGLLKKIRCQQDPTAFDCSLPE